MQMKQAAKGKTKRIMQQIVHQKPEQDSNWNQTEQKMERWG